jgi:hypothetical protein
MTAFDHESFLRRADLYDNISQAFRWPRRQALFPGWTGARPGR